MNAAFANLRLSKKAYFAHHANQPSKRECGHDSISQASKMDRLPVSNNLKYFKPCLKSVLGLNLILVLAKLPWRQPRSPYNLPFITLSPLMTNTVIGYEVFVLYVIVVTS